MSGGFGSYGVMLLALGILLAGVAVLAVTRRRRAKRPPTADPSDEHTGSLTVPQMQTWQKMREQIHAQLERQTGQGVAEWNARIKALTPAPADEQALRDWLEGEGLTGYPQMLLVFETFGYPDFLLATADELVDAQYADRPDLRPVFDSIIAAVSAFDGVQVQARKTYVSLLTRRRTFAVVQASTKKRVDVGLRLTDSEVAASPDPEARLLPAKSLGNESITRRLALESLADLDAPALAWLRRAYDANG